MTLNLNKAFHYIIIFGLIIVPFLSFSETYALMYSSERNLSQLLTPWYIKIIKDFIFISIILIGILWTLTNKNDFYLKFSWSILFLLFILSIGISFFQVNSLTILAGLRWGLPLLSILFLINRVDRNIQVKIAKILIFLVLIGLIMQIFQTSSLTNYFGPNQFGFSKRNPGFFTIPSTMAILILLSIWYVYNFLPKSRFNYFFLFVLAPISLYLAGSATGFIVLLLLFLSILTANIKQKRTIMFISILLLVSLVVSLPLLTNRADLFVSLFTRIQLFDHVSFVNLFLGDRFGLATNTAMLMKPSFAMDSDPFTTDSLILSFVINTGLLSLMLFIYILVKDLKYNLMEIQFFLIVIPFCFNSILFEVYPASLLISVTLAYFMSSTYHDNIRLSENKDSQS